MNKIFAVLLAASCTRTLVAGELKIVKATWGNGDKVNDATEALQEHMRGIEGVFLYISPSNKEFGPDPAPGKKKELTVVYTDGGAEKTVVLPEKKRSVILANAEPSEEFKVLGAFYGRGNDWNDVTETVQKTLADKGSVMIDNKAFGPDPAPRQKKELWVVYTKGGAIDYLPIKEKTKFSEESLKDVMK